MRVKKTRKVDLGQTTYPMITNQCAVLTFPQCGSIPTVTTSSLLTTSEI